jgi:hypothetical protein
MPKVLSWALDIPKEGTPKRKTFDSEVAEIGARISKK